MSRQLYLNTGNLSIADGVKVDLPFWNFSILDDLNVFEADKEILIVEDDLSTTKLFKAMINKFSEHTKIKSINTAEEAKKYLSYLVEQGLDGPSVALIDYNLGGENGLIICHLLDIYFPETKVVVVSGLEPEEIKKQIREKKLAVEFVSKPVNQEKMVYILSGYNSEMSN
jgi:response regulator of citrate/malate metabolism